MIEKMIPTYVDTSVFGGMFDDEFAEASRQFFDQVRVGVYQLIISTVVRDELESAPPPVKAFFEQTRRHAKIVDVVGEAIRLQRAYLEAGIVGSRWEADALHVAVATVCGCRLIVSWNFKHMVNFQKILLYNGINLDKGYDNIAIHSPREVIVDEDENI